MSTETRVLVSEDTDEDEPEVRFSIDDEAFRSGEVGLTLERGNESEQFRVTDADEAIYEGAGGVPTWCEGSIRRLGLYLDAR